MTVVALLSDGDVSGDEQGRRLEERLQDPTKNWKFRQSDVEDRVLWDEYQAAYEDVFARCSTKAAPWYIVPANRKWYRNLVVAQVIADAMEEMQPTLPRIEVDPDKVKIPP